MVSKSTVQVEVVYAMPDEQYRECITVPEGSTARCVVESSTVLAKLKQVDMSQIKIGIYGRLITLDTVMQDGDRLEVYRPLRADPKTVRRMLAKQGKSMGKSR